MVSQQMVYLGTNRSAIRDLFEYGQQRIAQVGRENVFDFSIGNPSVPPPPSVNEAARRLLEGEGAPGVHSRTCPEGDLGVRRAIAEDLDRRFGAGVSAEDLFLTAGASAALGCAFGALACPGDEFIVFAPHYPEYKVFIEQTGCPMRVVAPDPDTLQIDPVALERALTPHTKAVVINSPNNPSGVIYHQTVLREMAALLERKGAEYGHPIYVVTDEPYREIVFEGHSVPWVPSIYADTIVCYSYSKSLSLPGERIGYVLVPPSAADHDDVYTAVAGAARMRGYICAPSLFQQLLIPCRGQTSDISVYAKNAKLLVSGLRGMGFTCVEPQGAFYLFVRAPDGDGTAFSALARSLDLLLVPGLTFAAPEWVRLAFCVPTELIERAMPRFRELAEKCGLL